MVQEAAEEVTGGDVEAALEVGREHDLFVGVLRRERLAERCLPLNLQFWLQQPLGDQCLDPLFQQLGS